MAVIFLRDVPDDLHYRLKVQAAKERTTMKDLLLRLAEEYLEKAERKGGDR